MKHSARRYEASYRCASIIHQHTSLWVSNILNTTIWEDRTDLEHADPPHALTNLAAIKKRLRRRAPAFFLDFDGTLAPIAARPELAEMTEQARLLLDQLASWCPVCIVSGRSWESLHDKIALNEVYYAADHGHRIVGPEGSGIDFQPASNDTPELEVAESKLERALSEIDGVLIERKEVTVAVHYRGVAAQERPLVRDAVFEVLQDSPGLKLMEGKMVYEVLPDVGWGKGHAVLWLLERLKSQMRDEHLPICVGDDVTDEDMFVAVDGRGISVVVGSLMRESHADYRLRDTTEVTDFLSAFVPQPAWAVQDEVQTNDR